MLFDGKTLDGWTKRDGKTPATWKLVDGGIMQVAGRRHHHQGEVRRQLQAARRVPRPLHAQGHRPGPRQQRRLPPGPLRGAGARQLRPRRARTTIAAASTASPRRSSTPARRPTVWQSYDIDFQSPECEGRQEHRAGRHDRPPQRRQDPRQGPPGRKKGDKEERTTPPPAWAATPARPARSCCRTTAIRCSIRNIWLRGVRE